VAIAADYGRHVLDLSLEEVMPEGPGKHGMRRRPLIDKPGVRADDEFHVRRKKVVSRAELLTALNVLIDAALAAAGALNSDSDNPDLVALCEGAGLTLSEYEATTMRANGLSWSDIARAQGVTPSTTRRAAERGFAKLRALILTAT
jgi:DNA-binding CsgD family transcriptional regulator